MNHQTQRYLARLIVTGRILHLPSLRQFVSLLPISHHLIRLSLHYFPHFPSATITPLFNLLFHRLSSSFSSRSRHHRLLFSLFSSSLLPLSSPDSFTFPPLLNSLPSPSSLFQLHPQILKRGLLSHPFVLNSLLSSYSHLNLFHQTLTLFQAHTNQTDVVSWNIMISHHIRNGSVASARQLFDEMPDRNDVSWSAIISGYASMGDMDVACYLFDRMPNKSVTAAWTSMVAGFAKCGLVGMARKYFDEMPQRSLISWNVMVNGYTTNGEMGLAKELFEGMRERDVVSWSCLIKGFVMGGRYLEALRIFKEMVEEGKVRPNEVTMVSVLSACAHLSALDHGRWVHGYIDRNSMVLDDDCNLGAALIDMYFKCASVEPALVVFESLERRNVSSWNALITGLGINGLASDALVAFEEMQKSGTKPNDITFVGVLMACTHGGLVEEGRRYFKSMCDIYRVKCQMKHYGCMVDLLGRAGLLVEAEEIVKGMPMKPDVMVLGALLGACRTHGNAEVAERIKTDFLELNSRQAGCHLLLSNIYAAADRWADASNVRDNLKIRGISKIAGSSSVELDGGVQEEVMTLTGTTP